MKAAISKSGMYSQKILVLDSGFSLNLRVREKAGPQNGATTLPLPPNTLDRPSGTYYVVLIRRQIQLKNPSLIYRSTISFMSSVLDIAELLLWKTPIGLHGRVDCNAIVRSSRVC